MIADTAVEPTTDAMDYTIEELESQYPGEWMVIHVTERNIHSPTRGRVVYHSKDKEDAYKSLKVTPDRLLGIYYGGPRPLDGTEYLISIWETHDDTTA